MTADSKTAQRTLPVHLAIASGLLMGTADAVPGVSGGTIALIIGIYERFIESLHTVVRTPLLIGSADGRARLMRAFGLLVPLGIGLVAAYWVMTRILVGPEGSPGLLLRADTAPLCYAFFFGLVVCSLREPWRRIKKFHPAHIGIAVVGAAAAALFVGLPYRTATPETWMIALGGAGAITVMLLPGVSGSMLLVILGQYTTVAGAVHNRDLGLMGVFVAGIAGGVVVFVPLLRFLLHRHHDLTMAALTGLMAGSLRALWPWKTHYDPKNVNLGAMTNTGIGDHLPGVIVAVVLGGAVVWLLAMLERRILAAPDPDQA